MNYQKFFKIFRYIAACILLWQQGGLGSIYFMQDNVVDFQKPSHKLDAGTN